MRVLRAVVYTFFFLLLFSTLQAREIDLDTLSAAAAKQQKHLLVWMHKNGCGYCAAMHDYTLEADRVKTMLARRFALVHINVSENDTVTYKAFRGNGRQFAKKMGYDFYPTSLFFNKNGEPVFAAPGYIEETPFMQMLEYIDSGAYLHQSYNDFIGGKS